MIIIPRFGAHCFLVAGNTSLSTCVACHCAIHICAVSGVICTNEK